METSSSREKLNQLRDLVKKPEIGQAIERSKYTLYIRNMRKKITNEYGGQIVTKGWLKCMDILQHLNFKGGKVFFNAELPGAFTFATNHYISMNSLPFDWLLASFYPQSPLSTSSLEDKYGILPANRFHSLVGEVETSLGRYWIDGDLTREGMPYLLSQLVINSLGKVQLYTADGGMDVLGKENAQEEINYPLIYGEFKTGILSLDLGGTMIIKIYTAFTAEMRSLLAYAERFFKKVEYYKPSASSPYNSEVYFLGLEFKGPWEWNETAARETMPDEEIIDILEEFTKSQIKALESLSDKSKFIFKGNDYAFMKKLERSKWIPTQSSKASK